jgi:hypothetical protein
MRSSPGSLRPASRLRWRALESARSAAARIPFVLRDFGVVRAKVREPGGALCRPLSSVPVAVRGGNHGVSDPAARARRGPAPVRGGRSRHGCLCRCWLSSTACSAARSAACLPHRTRSIATQIFRTIRSRSSGKCCPQTRHIRSVFAGQFCREKWWTRAHAFDVDLPPSLGDHIWRRVNAVGHHDNDAASVLGTVQGAALRSARACARPSGLDGACAQMIGTQLRDGRRMLFPSGTDGALIDPLDDLPGAFVHVRSFPEVCA